MPPKKSTKTTAIKSAIDKKRLPFGFALDTLSPPPSSSTSSSDSESSPNANKKKAPLKRKISQETSSSSESDSELPPTPIKKKASFKKHMPKKAKTSQKKDSPTTKDEEKKTSHGRRKAANPARLRRGVSVTSSAAAAESRRMLREQYPDIPRAAFQRLVREILFNENVELRYQRAAVEALQMASEAFMVQMMENMNLLAIHAGRVTIFPADLKLAVQLGKR